VSELTEEALAVLGAPDFFRPHLTMPCPSCGSPKITFPVDAVSASGVTRLHGITACPECDDPKQIVVEWRNDAGTGR
jgi:hypothetical protein